jgi:ubiquinone/menaquinone biosynthesis C-methylase UbiE
MSEMQSFKDQKKIHDKVYEKTFDLKEYLIPSDRIKIKIIYEMLDIKKGERILDVGCGTGTTLVAANGLGAHPFGMDISIKGLQKAKHKIDSGSFVSGDAHFLPFKDNIFNAVICKDILEHLSNDDIALREVNSVLKK